MRRIGLLSLVLFTTCLAVWLVWDGGSRAVVYALLAAAGPTGFALFTVVYNVLVIPFPYDPFLAATPWLYPGQGLAVLLAAMVGTLLAAGIDYALGHILRPAATRWFGGHPQYPRVLAKLQQYGWGVVALSAVTPLPFSLVCWVCGIARTHFGWFILTVLVTRGVRHGLVWALAWGMLG